MDNEETIEQLKTESLIKRILTTEVKYIIGIVVFLAGVVAPYYQIKTDIALIRQNHFSHMEAMTKEITDNSSDIKEMKSTQINLMKIISENSVRIKNLEK